MSAPSGLRGAAGGAALSVVLRDPEAPGPDPGVGGTHSGIPTRVGGETRERLGPEKGLPHDPHPT